MKDTPLYSIVIFPTPEQLELIKSYKQLLKKKIDWFNSVDSAAHITIIQLKTDLELAFYIDRIREFCKTVSPQNVTFNSWDRFEQTGAFFMAPNIDSKLYLDSIIINLHDFLGFTIDKSNVNSHMSIARRLFGERMNTTQEFFKNIDVQLQFNCDALYVRKFNGRQYANIVEKIPFGKQ